MDHIFLLAVFRQFCYCRHKNILLVLTFDKRSANAQKLLFARLFVVGQKFNLLFRNHISDSLSLVGEILKIVSDVFFLFLTAFDITLMLLLRFFFCESAPLISKRFESLILFVRFCVVFDFNLAECRALFHGEDVSLHVTTFSALPFSESEKVVIFCCSKQQLNVI